VPSAAIHTQLIALNSSSTSTTNSTMTAEGSSDSFTWRSLFADKLVENKGSKQIEVPVDEALKGKHVALYFSAHW
jgi:hypothetical protein